MRILHTYCLNYNLGDHALGIGVKNILRHCFAVDSIGETNLQGQVFNDYYIDVINRNYDLLVIGGGGIIHGAHWPQGWFWLIEKEDIRKIKIPFIVYAVGYNYFRGEKPIPAHGIAHLKETQKQALHFSVRNDGSYDRLREQTGIEANVLADAGFWVPLNRTYTRPIAGPYIMVQLANDKPAFRFGSEEGRAQFIQKMRAVICGLARTHRVIAAPHVLADVELCREVVDGIENAAVWDFSTFAFDRTHECLGYYQFADLVLAMRGHGQILPLSFGVPVISLENHDKNIGLMRNLGLVKYNVDIKDPDLVEKVTALAGELIGNPEIRGRIEAKNQQLLAETVSQFGDIARGLQ